MIKKFTNSTLFAWNTVAPMAPSAAAPLIWWCGHVTNTYLKRIKAVPSYFEPMKFGVPINHGLISLVARDECPAGRHSSSDSQ